MIAVLQRVNRAAVLVEGSTVGEIGHGLLILLGVSREDTAADAELLVKKIAACRIFRDGADKMNLSVRDVAGGVLVVSNFTLLADYAHGNRPSYFEAASPAEAQSLYLYFAELMAREVSSVATGEFGAHMQISMEADGPVTIVMDSRVLQHKGKEKKI
ncbi:MAG: D-tyrosyl-tRNA(Tyr) deacylase [Clostridia bacterium]|nr:D-tyrosyl-tRNA(Tyr) deacylase [Clostridia bacterium]